MVDGEHIQAEHVEWYKGSKLNISWHLQTYQKEKMGKRHIQCFSNWYSHNLFDATQRWAGENRISTYNIENC
jgi:hypothetical protein